VTLSRLTQPLEGAQLRAFAKVNGQTFLNRKYCVSPQPSAGGNQGSLWTRAFELLVLPLTGLPGAMVASAAPGFFAGA
jgi:hypothetical protein